MKHTNTFLVCGGLLLSALTGTAQSGAGGDGGLVTPPDPIHAAPARIQMTPVNTGANVAATTTVTTSPAPARSTFVPASTSTNRRPVPVAVGAMKPATPATTKHSPAQVTNTTASKTVVSKPVPLSAQPANPTPRAAPIPIAAAPVPSATTTSAAPVAVTTAPPTPAPVAAPPVAVTPTPMPTLPAPTAMPVQPVIPGFDPAPFLAEEKSMVEAITNTAPEDEVILELKFDDVDLLDLIKSLALQADLNILFDPKLVNQIGPDGAPLPQPIVPAFSMSNVTAKQALEAVLDNYNYQMVHDPKTNTYRVTEKSASVVEPLITRILKLKYSNPTNLVEVLNAVVTPKGSVTPYSRTQQLIIKATEEQWEMVHQLLDELDTPLKQVLIEANILETAHNPQSLKGIDWSGTLAAQNFSFGNGNSSGTFTQTRPGATTTTTQTLPSGRTLTTSSTQPSTLSETLTSVVGGGVAGLTANTRDGLFPPLSILNADGVRGVLSYLNSDSATDVIATPRAVMLDGDTARLEVTRAFPIFEITPGSANSPAGASISYTNMGTILEVTPTVQANDYVGLHVIPEVSNIDGQDSQTINGVLNQANVYAIRRIETRVMVPSAHTLVMGGLINDTKTESKTKVPLFGDIPGLGRAFRRTSTIQRKQNLLIFITPTILEVEHFQAPQTDFLHGVNQPTGDDFLRSRIPDREVEKEKHFMDSAEPYDWKKKRKGGFFKWGHQMQKR